MFGGHKKKLYEADGVDLRPNLQNFSKLSSLGVHYLK